MQSSNLVRQKFQQGFALHQQGRLAAAAAVYAEVLRLQPRHFAALHLTGVIARDQGDPARAVALIRQAITLNSGIGAAHANLGNALQDMGRLDEALAAFDRALALEPDLAEIHRNRGNALSDLHRYGEAIMAYDAALRLQPGSAAAHCYRGMALVALGRPAEAEAAFARAIALQPDFADAHLNLATTQLLLGDLERGLAGYEWRKRATLAAANRTFPRPLLSSPAEARGRAVLVHWEQGLGDTIQFARYLHLLQQAGARVLFAPQPQLRALMRGLDPPVAIVAEDEPGLAFDFHVPLMSLPLLFGTRLDTIPAPTSYLAAPPERVMRWRGRIGGHGFRIGICWQGNPAYKPDAFRSFPLAQFAGLARLAGVRLVGLHKGSGEAQLETLPPGMAVERLGADFDAGPDAFLDTAAAMKTLDLVITSDTAIAHLAGALGVPVWVVLGPAPEWRWFLGRADSPWYPGMRIFRATEPGVWTPAFDAMMAALLLKGPA